MSHPGWVHLLGALALCMLSPVARASTSLALDVPALTRSSELVVHGRVLRTTSRQVQDTGRIVTDVEVSVTEFLRGSAARSSLHVVLPGGIVGDLRQDVSGAPELAPGEEVVLFLSHGTEGPRVVGLAQGAFRVHRSENGREVLASAVLPEALRLVDPLSLQPVPTQARTMALQVLREQVRGGVHDTASPALDEPTSPPPFVRTRTPPTESAPEGHCLWWPGGSTLTFHQQQCMSGEPDCTARQASVGLALQGWDEILAGCTSLRLSEGPVTASRQVGYVPSGPNENIILLRDRACTQPESEDCWRHGTETLAMTTSTFRMRSGEVLDTDIELNAVAFFSQTPTVDLQGAVTHELGHALGLAHSPDSRSTMYPHYQGQGSSSAIDEGSRQAMCSIYPPGAPAVDCVEAEPELRQLTSKPQGCSAAPGAGAGALLLGLVTLLAPRRRRPENGG
ncbi:matrixin family metalloprotease [Archangium violaceum]|uniref:matrixin family metalloprotease n=1 Tax=Archangium violaceum TaxID=83451 RepID=UPI0019511209|nr:matrixin family metalloprotease [Archangium violaceum]QRN95239.1 matrixin family metalloprotease [Archangium violaceum]